jgi:hypothetical protein
VRFSTRVLDKAFAGDLKGCRKSQESEGTEVV